MSFLKTFFTCLILIFLSLFFSGFGNGLGLLIELALLLAVVVSVFESLHDRLERMEKMLDALQKEAGANESAARETIPEAEASAAHEKENFEHE